MANQITTVGCAINFAAPLANTLDGNAKGAWTIKEYFYIPAGGNGDLLYGLGKRSDHGATSPRFLYTEDGSQMQLRDMAASSCAYATNFAAHLIFDGLNEFKIEKVVESAYPNIYVNGNLVTRTQDGGSWETVPPFGSIGMGSFRYEGRTSAGFSYTDDIEASTINDRLFSYDGELATPAISELINGQHPSIYGAGTPIWSVVGGGSPTIDDDVEEGTPINIYTGSGLTGTPKVLINGVSVPFTGDFPNLVVTTDLTTISDVFHGFDLDAPLVLRVEHDAGGYNNDIIIRSRVGYTKTTMFFPESGTGTIDNLIPGISVKHTDVAYFPTINNTNVLANGRLLTDATTIPIIIGKYADDGIFWYPYTISFAAVAPALGSDVVVNVNDGETAVGTYDALTGTDPIVYTLTGADAATFNIDSATGAVTFKVPPDFDVDPTTYAITVTATNGEGADSQNITVNVLEVAAGGFVGNVDTDNQITSNQTFNINLNTPTTLAANEGWYAHITIGGTDYPLTVNSETSTSVNVTAPGNLPAASVGNAVLTVRHMQIAP